jgi:cyclopropane fatty-acyl-phospholipid synthase-like methyltransferase
MSDGEAMDEIAGVGPRGSTFRDRFIAWWEGYYLPEEDDEPPADDRPLMLTERAPPAEPTVAEVDDPNKIWSRWRIEAAEHIWGRDFVIPGGAEYAVKLAKPLGLGPATSLVDLSAMLGGGTRAMVDAFGVWITGLEADPDLAEEGDKRSRQRDLENKAPIRAYDPARVELKTASFDRVFSRDLIYLLPDREKELLLTAVHRGLKEKGHLLFTDLVLKDDAPTEIAQNWARRERPQAHPWSVDRMMAKLSALDFDVRICEDETDYYRSYILQAFADLVAKLEARAIPKAIQAKVFEEAERWAARMTAIDKGGLRSYRIHAIK